MCLGAEAMIGIVRLAFPLYLGFWLVYQSGNSLKGMCDIGFIIHSYKEVKTARVGCEYLTNAVLDTSTNLSEIQSYMD